MTTTTTEPRAVLLGDDLHCPRCARTLDIWEETRHIDRVPYTEPRYDTDANEWTYAADGHTENVSVELLDRYAQCPARNCGYTTPTEPRWDE